MKILGKIQFKALGRQETKVTLVVEPPDVEAAMDKSLLERRLQATVYIRNQLFESER